MVSSSAWFHGLLTLCYLVCVCESIPCPLVYWEVGVVHVSDGKCVSSQVFIHTICS